MIKLSQLIDFISNGGTTDIDVPIYRTICPLEVDFPAITFTHSDSEILTDINGDINIEKLTIEINSFATTADAADALTSEIFLKLKTLKGDIDTAFRISSFLLNNRKSIDYTDEITNKLVYGNQLQYRVICKKL